MDCENLIVTKNKFLNIQLNTKWIIYPEMIFWNIIFSSINKFILIIFLIIRWIENKRET